MCKFKKFNIETFYRVLNWAGWPLIVAYVICMFIYPIISTQNWEKIQDIWDRWQGLNVGMLAFVSSLIAFNISRYKSEQERKRNFIAARAFLPEAFSELTDYCESSMHVLAEAWVRADYSGGQRRAGPLQATLPTLPSGYREVFRDCIKAAAPEVGDLLAYILMKIQIHHSRLQDIINSFQPGSSFITTQSNIKSYLYGIAEIQALINKLFDYARGLGDFDNSPLVYENFRNALSCGDIIASDYEDLQGFIERALARETEQ